MRPTGFDSTDLRRSRSGLALSQAHKRRVEVSDATVAAETDCEQAAFGL